MQKHLNQLIVLACTFACILLVACTKPTVKGQMGTWSVDTIVIDTCWENPLLGFGCLPTDTINLYNAGTITLGEDGVATHVDSAGFTTVGTWDINDAGDIDLCIPISCHPFFVDFPKSDKQTWTYSVALDEESEYNVKWKVTKK